MNKEHGLTPRQERFAIEVASGKSQSEAYRLAYPGSVKWKDKTVWEKASCLADNGKVSARVSELQAAAAEKAVDEAVLIAQENLRLARSRISGIMHPDGRVRLPHELDPETEAAVASFKIDEYGRIEYKFWDKNSALERAAKITKMFADRLELTGKDGGPIQAETVTKVVIVPAKIPAAVETKPIRHDSND